MAYMFVVGSCINCKKTISFNPNYVPSIRVNGEKEPLCKNCFDGWNQIHRISKNLAPVEIHPQAYEPEEC